METYLLMICVTLEQENAIRRLFTWKGWAFEKTDSADVDHHWNKPVCQSPSRAYRSSGNDDQWYTYEGNKRSANQLCSEFKSENNDIVLGQNHLSTELEDKEDVKQHDTRCIVTRSVKRKIDEQTEIKSDHEFNKRCLKKMKSKKKKKLKISYKFPAKESNDNERIVDKEIQTTNHDFKSAVTQSVNDDDILNKTNNDNLLQTSYTKLSSNCSVIALGKGKAEKESVCNVTVNHQISLPDIIRKSKTKTPKGKSNVKISEIPKVVAKGRKASKGEYHCHECDFTFKYASAFNNHKKDGACVFICSYCGKRYTARYYFNYQLHMKYHNNEKQHLCSTCGKAFTEKSKLTIHLRSHSNERPYICDTCGRAFYTSMLLRCHIKHMHRERPKSFSCDLCNSKFVSIYNLNTHKNVTHSNARPFQCQICLKTFKTKYALEKKHMSFHDENGQLFYCNSCPKSFRKKEYLNLHMKRHKNERTHFCDKCGKGFYDMKTLKEHNRTHSGEKPYACSKCEYRCALKGNLSKHMKTHLDEQCEEKEIKVSNMMNDPIKDFRAQEKEIGDPILNPKTNVHPESYPLLSLPGDDMSRSQNESSRTQNDLLKSQNEREQNELIRPENETLSSDNEFSNSLPMLPVLMRYDSFSQYQDSLGVSSLDGSAFSRHEPGLSQSDLNYTQYGNLFDTVINPFSFHLK